MMIMTYALAMAAGKDAANERMRKAGRSVWNRADYNVSVRTFNRLFGPPITPSVPPSIQGLLERREAEVRNGRIVFTS